MDLFACVGIIMFVGVVFYICVYIKVLYLVLICFIIEKLCFAGWALLYGFVDFKVSFFFFFVL